jgi:CO/xanthine dehydrogenase FAD-binding subunit
LAFPGILGQIAGDANPRHTRAPASAGVTPRPPVSEPWHDMVLIELKALALDYISESEPDTLHIGTATTLQTLSQSEALSGACGGIVALAAAKTAHHGLRNLATLGGALSDPTGAPELLAAMLACDAKVVVYDGARNTVELPELLNRPASEGPYLPLELTIEGGRGGKTTGDIEWIGRSPMDRAIVTAAACLRISGGAIESASIAIAGDGFPPSRISALGESLLELKHDQIDREIVAPAVQEAVEPRASYRASGEYQMELAIILTTRAVQGALAAEVM